MENYLRVSGKLYFQVLYVTDEVEPKLSAVEGRLPFEEMVYIEEGGSTGYIQCRGLPSRVCADADPFPENEFESDGRASDLPGSAPGRGDNNRN